MAEIQYVEWRPPGDVRRRQEEEARRRARAARRHRRLVLVVLFAAGAGGVLVWWGLTRRGEVPPAAGPGAALPGATVPVGPPPPPALPGAGSPPSTLERSLELWYALTRSAEVGETQVQATLQTPALVALRAAALGKEAGWPARFDHDSYLYVEVRVGVKRGSLREAFLADPAGSLTLVDDAGGRVRGTIPEALQEEAVALARDEGAKGVTGVAFLAAFPRTGLSRTTRFLRMEVANLAPPRRPGLTWEVTPGTVEAVLSERRP